MRWAPAIFLALCGGVALRADAPAAPPALPALATISDSKPLVFSGQTQVDFTSKVTGRAYRLLISAPPVVGVAKPRPVVYVLDGYWYFQPAAGVATEGGGRFQFPIIVGIGYPTDDTKEYGVRRLLDLSIPPVPTVPPTVALRPSDGDNFLRMIQEEVKPWVQNHYYVDTAHQTLYGKSLGGLMVLRQMFRNPSAFQTYVAASPSIGRNGHAVLADEAAFSEQAKAGKLHLRLLLTSAELEQYRGTDPVKMALNKNNRMVDDASELATRLKALDPKDVGVDYVVFPGEDHFTVSLAALGRAMCFALDTPEP